MTQISPQPASKGYDHDDLAGPSTGKGTSPTCSRPTLAGKGYPHLHADRSSGGIKGQDTRLPISEHPSQLRREVLRSQVRSQVLGERGLTGSESSQWNLQGVMAAFQVSAVRPFWSLVVPARA